MYTGVLTAFATIVLVSVMLVKVARVNLKENYPTVDWNDVKLYDKVKLEGDNFFLEDGRKVVWLEADEQKAIDYISKIAFNLNISR